MASGDRLAEWDANDAQFSGSNFATRDERSGVVDIATVLDFDDTAAEDVYFGGVMPPHYSGATGVTVTLVWTSTTSNTGAVSWSAAFSSFTPDVDDFDSASFATFNNVNDDAPASPGRLISASITFTDGADMDSVVAGEYFRLRVRRDATGASSTDDMVGDAEIFHVILDET